MANSTLIDEMVKRLTETLITVLPKESAIPAELLSRLAERIKPAIDNALKPFQILRREEFDGYLAQLQRLESQVGELEIRLARFTGD